MNLLTTSEIHAQTLPDQVYLTLRDAILNGVYRPDHMLRQEALAASLGISRAPLREAMPRLEADGLVVNHPRRGYAVRSLNLGEIEEIFELRLLVEGRAAYLATLHRTQNHIDQLKVLIAQIEAIKPSTEAEIIRWSDLNFEFHDRLLAPSPRRHFRRVVQSLRFAVEPYIRMEISLTGESDDAEHEHRHILDAFIAGDAAQVEHLTKEHCEHTATRLLDALKQRLP
ncbi:MAG: GntR family transcriptional regulator [Gammaproteobacteria bacterium]